MNIISNCCATGYLYKNILKEQFPNMFIWSAMLPKDVILLIRNYDKINFENIKLEESFIHKRIERNFKIVIDNLVSVHYTHYILSEDKSPKVIGYNVYFSNIKDFTIEKYKNRLKRKSFTEEPVFLILDNKNDMTFTNEEMSELLSCTEKK